MRTCDSILLLVLVALPSAVAMGQSADKQQAEAAMPATQQIERQVPITFARSGQKVSAELEVVNFPHKEFVLRAFGRVWTLPAPLKNERGAVNWIAEFEAPSVRVPTVFAITPTRPVRWFCPNR